MKQIKTFSEIHLKGITIINHAESKNQVAWHEKDA
jgi:hypothetical protein